MADIDQAIDQMLSGGGSSGQEQSTSASVSRPQGVDSALESLISAQPENTRQSPIDIVKKTAMLKNLGNPLSTGERFAFSFASDSEKEVYLKDKFRFVERLPNGKYAAGDSLDTVRAVDPEGIVGDLLGDIADAGSLIAPIAGQIAGATVGSAAGPGGTIAGGASGAGLGEGINQIIARAYGFDRSPEEAAVNVIASTTFGALGEGIGLGLRAATSSQVAQKGFSAVKSLLKSKGVSHPVKDRAIGVFGKVLNAASNIPEEAVDTLIRYDDVVTPFNKNIRNVTALADSVVNDIASHRRVLGEAVGAAKKAFGRNYEKPVVDIGQDVGKFLLQLRESNIVNSAYRVNRDLITDGSDITIFNKVLRNLKVGPSGSGQSIRFQNKMSPKDIIGLKRQLSAKFESLSDDGTRLVASLRSSISERLNQFASKSGNQDFIIANQKFSQFADAMDNLKLNGFNMDKPANVENFVKGFFKQSQSARQALEIIDKQTTLPILLKVKKFASAQAVQDVRPDIFRLGFIAGLFGLSMSDTPGGKIGSVALASLFGSPAGNRLLIEVGKRIARGTSIKVALPSLLKNGPFDERAAIATISQLSRRNLSQERRG